jgi:hypothetical protein
MKYYSFNEYCCPSEGYVLTTYSEDTILDFYWDAWCNAMMNHSNPDRQDMINEQHCIDDFVTVNWAWETDSKGNFIG